MIYMKGMETIVIDVLDYHFDVGLFRLCILLLFSSFVELFSTRVFLIGNPYLILREGEVNWVVFPHSKI